MQLIDAPKAAHASRFALMSLLDRLLHPSRRTAGHEELRKARILAGTVALLTIAAWPSNCAVLLERPPGVIAAMLVGLLVCYHVALVRLRFSRDPLGRPALIACAPILLIFVFLAVHQGGSRFVTNPWNIAIGLFVTYFVGARAGLALAGFLSFELVVSCALERLGLALPPMPTGSGMALVISDVLGLGAIGAIGSLYALSRSEAHDALDRALTSVARSEAQLVTLVENTDDLIASVDAGGRLAVANTAFLRTFRQLMGQAPVVGDEISSMLKGANTARWVEQIRRALGGERVEIDGNYAIDGAPVNMEFVLSPIPGLDGRSQGMTLFGRNITARRAAEEKLKGVHQQLIDLSRQAGMAEVATGILHNVGNTLNSVNVSASLASETLRRSKVVNLAKVAEMLREHASDRASFLANDPKGRLVLDYVVQLAEALVSERDELQAELAELGSKVDHIKAVVRLQQEHAHGGGLVEVVPVRELVESALRLHDESFIRLGIEFRSECAEMAPIAIDRHKLLQILVNLLGNARHALMDSGRADKRLSIIVDVPDAARVRIRVIDNGVGILPENKPQLFRQGFTTRKQGHGFGLHMSSLNAAALGGTLVAESAGRDQGATFTLNLPVVGMNRAPVREDQLRA